MAGQAAFTVMIVVLFNLAKPGAWELPLLRVEDVAIGAATGIAIGLAIWPRGARAQVRGALAELVRGASALAGSSARAAMGEERRSATEADAARATVRADDVFTTFLAETGDRHRALELWAALLVHAHALRALSTLLPPGRVAVPRAQAPAELATALARAADGLTDDGGRVADALLARTAPESPAGSGGGAIAFDAEIRSAGRRAVAVAHDGAEGAEPARAVVDGADTASAVVDLFLLGCWIERARDELARIEALVRRAAPGASRDRPAVRAA